MSKKLTNVTLAEFRKYLIFMGCEKDRITGGHEFWKKPGIRPITIQTHISPVPPHVIKSALKNLGVTVQDFLNWFE